MISRQITKLQYFLDKMPWKWGIASELQHKFIMIPVDFEEAVFLSCFKKKKTL